MFWQRKHKVAANVLASSLFEEFVETPIQWDASASIDTNPNSVSGRKVRLYQFASVMLGVLDAEHRDKAFSPVRKELERRFFPPTFSEGADLLEEVRRAMQDLAELMKPSDQSRPIDWAIRWLHDAGIRHHNPAILLMFVIRWPSHFTAVMKALRRFRPQAPDTAPNERHKELKNLSLDAVSPTDITDLKSKAHDGDSNAQNDFGLCYYTGIGVSQDYKEAAKWYQKSAEQGNSEAQSNLAYCYSQGHGLPQDQTEAFKWWSKAAQQGHALAAFSLGCCFQNGEGVVPNMLQAVKWYRKAAEQGLASAQCNLGSCYANGDGVPLDMAKAVYWYRKAAEQGNAAARNFLELFSQA